MTDQEIYELSQQLNEMDCNEEYNSQQTVSDCLLIGQDISDWDNNIEAQANKGDVLTNPFAYLNRKTYAGPVEPQMKLWIAKEHNQLANMSYEEQLEQVRIGFEEVAEYHAKNGKDIDVISEELIKCNTPYIKKHYNITDHQLLKLASNTYKELHYKYSSVELSDEEQIALSAYTTTSTESGFEELEEWMNTRTEQFSFDIQQLDTACGGGIMRGEVLSIIGNPGSMKTSLLIRGIMNWLYQNKDTKVVMFSLDMDKSAIYERLFMRQLACDSKTFREHYIHKSQQYITALGQLKEATINRLEIVQNTYKNRWNVQSVKNYVAKNMPDLICIDYLTLLKNGKQGDYEIANEACIALKEIAQKYNCLVVILSQMSLESRRIQASGGTGGSAKGGGIINELSTMEIELFRDVSANPEDYAPRIIATITKTRRGIAGASYMLDYNGPSMTFTGHAQRVKRCSQRKPVFET